MNGDSVTLTDEQEALVALDDGAHLIVAPPGSGKTEVLAQRIVRLIQVSPGESFKILALSFTKAAANSMRRRVGERLGENTWRVVCSTYHAFCGDLLRSYGQLIELPADFTIYDSVEDRLQALALGLVKGALLDERAQIDRGQAIKLLDSISRLKRDLVPPDAAPDEWIGGFPVPLRAAYTAYELALRQNGALDFDGVISRAYELLSARPDVAQEYRSSYRYILIDEAQDTSRCQYELLKALCGSDHRNVLMVADPAQSIFAFAGASSKFVHLFERDFRARRHTLTVTFRCGASILRVAAPLLPDASRSASGPQPKASAKGLVSFNEFASETAEAIGAVDWLTHWVSSGLPAETVAQDEETSVRPEETAVMARSRNNLREVIRELEDRDLPYHFVTGDAGLFDTTEYQIVLYALKCIANRHDVALSRTLFTCVTNARFASALSDYEEDVVDDTARLLPALAADLSSTAMGEAMSALAMALDPATPQGQVLERLIGWEPTTATTNEDEQELLAGDRRLLKERWVTYRNRPSYSDAGWHGFVLELVSNPRPESDGIRVLTVHASKGLEFKAVAVVGLNEGSFPDFRNSDDEGLESEQRLMYVAVTRASRALWLSRSKVRQTGYGARASESSRFLRLMGVTRA
jgi:DNA helicase-2/ATP-dependent DNA helicase PcrA